MNNDLGEGKRSKTKPMNASGMSTGIRNRHPSPDGINKERDRVKAIINSSMGVSRKHLDTLNANRPTAGSPLGTRIPSPMRHDTTSGVLRKPGLANRNASPGGLRGTSPTNSGSLSYPGFLGPPTGINGGLGTQQNPKGGRRRPHKRRTPI